VLKKCRTCRKGQQGCCMADDVGYVATCGFYAKVPNAEITHRAWMRKDTGGKAVKTREKLPTGYVFNHHLGFTI